jgi:hypothetical protein
MPGLKPSAGFAFQGASIPTVRSLSIRWKRNRGRDTLYAGHAKHIILCFSYIREWPEANEPNDDPTKELPLAGKNNCFAIARPHHTAIDEADFVGFQQGRLSGRVGKGEPVEEGVEPEPILAGFAGSVLDGEDDFFAIGRDCRRSHQFMVRSGFGINDLERFRIAADLDTGEVSTLVFGRDQVDALAV